MADGEIRIEITKGYDETNYCSDLGITTTAEAEAALENFEETYQQYQNVADGTGMDADKYRKLAESTVDKFKKGELPPNSRGSSATGNTKGIITGQAPSSARGADESNPEVIPETPEESEEGDSWLDGAQLGLDAAGMIPGFGAFFDVANAGVSLFRGDYAGAAFCLFAAIPGVGDAAAGTKMAKKAATVLERKIEKEAAERAAKEAAEKAEKEAAERAVKEESGNGGGKIKGKNEKGPCDHLKKGNGKGDYRGGAHGETKLPKGDGLDSHHAPADSASPLKRDHGPAMQMEIPDHKMTSSHGSSSEAIDYREEIADLLKNGQWRKALAKEIQDIRSSSGTKYNEAIKEMLLYFKCLEKNNLLG
jgi:hypothetical protein